MCEPPKEALERGKEPCELPEEAYELPEEAYELLEEAYELPKDAPKLPEEAGKLAGPYFAFAMPRPIAPKPEPATFCPDSPQHWREWLHQHHATQSAVWLVYHKQHTGRRGLSWSEAVDEALCYGWIDSVAQPLDADTYRQRFSPRQPRSGWSRVNKEKVARLLAEGRLMPAGLAALETAKQNGAWTLLDEVESLTVPPDLADALHACPGAAARFEALSRSARRLLLLELLQAKRPETRQRRLAAIVAKVA